MELPIEIWCQVFDSLNDRSIGQCRLVSNQWNGAGGLILSKNRAPIRITGQESLEEFNELVASSAQKEMFTRLEIQLGALATSGSTQAVTTFLNTMSSTVRKYNFGGPRRPKMGVSVDITAYGKLITTFLRSCPRLTSLSINFQEEFEFQTDSLQGIASFQQLRHVSAYFPYRYSAHDEHLLLGAVLDHSPRLVKLDLAFEFRQSKPKAEAQPVLSCIQELLRKLSRSVKIGIKAKAMSADLPDLAEFNTATTNHTVFRIDIDPGDDWVSIIWPLALKNVETLVILKVHHLPLPQNQPLIRFPKLRVLVVQGHLAEMPDNRYALAFETLRVLNAGKIVDPGVMGSFIANLVNLEELKMAIPYEQNSSTAITGETIIMSGSDVLNGAWFPSKNADASENPSPFINLKNLKVLVLASSLQGLFGLVRCSKNGSLVPLKNLGWSQSPKPYPDYRHNGFTMRMRDNCKTQLGTYHQTVNIMSANTFKTALEKF